MIIFFSRGIVASTRLSIFPRAMNNAPGMRPRFHSLGSRTSRKTIEGSPSLSFIDPAAQTSLILVAHFFARRTKISRDKCCALLERAGENEMTQHSIDAINRFAGVLDDQDRSLEIRSKWSSKERCDQSEISAYDSPPHSAASQYSSVFGYST